MNGVLDGHKNGSAKFDYLFFEISMNYEIMTQKIIPWDLVRSIIEYIPLEDLRSIGRAHALFTREIYKMDLRVFYDGDYPVVLDNTNIVVQTGPKKVVLDYVSNRYIDHKNGHLIETVDLEICYWTFESFVMTHSIMGLSPCDEMVTGDIICIDPREQKVGGQCGRNLSISSYKVIFQDNEWVP